MRKFIAVFILIFGIIFSAAAQTPANLSGPMDLILLYDTSASMSDYYNETADYLTGQFLTDFLRIGDTFHLISFSKSPRLEISRLVEGVGEVEAIVGRILLMYPLDPESDITGALNFAEQYASSLPGNRHKKIILVSDGDNNNPAVQAAITATSARLNLKNYDLQFIKIPVTSPPPSSNRAPIVRQPAPPVAQVQQQPQQQTPQQQTPQQQTPQQQTPQQQTPQQQTPQQQIPQQQQQPQQQTPQQQTPQQQQPQQQTPQQQTPQQQQPQQQTPQQQTPQQQQPQPETNTVTTVPEPQTNQNEQFNQTENVPLTDDKTLDQKSGDNNQSSDTRTAVPGPGTGITQAQVINEDHTEIPWWLIAAIILGLLILALIIFFASRRLSSSPNRVMAQAASAPADNRDRLEADRQDKIKSAAMMSSYAESQRKSKPLPADKPVVMSEDQEKNGPPMLSFFVDDQNTAIGRRNIHTAKEGYRYTVGGGKSDFLIFLVPIPRNIAEVRYDGRQCTFIPLKPQFFPDIGSQQVSNCIGKSIRVLSEKKYELFIRIERYEDPLKALNKLLHSINMPG